MVRETKKKTIKTDVKGIVVFNDDLQSVLCTPKNLFEFFALSLISHHKM